MLRGVLVLEDVGARLWCSGLLCPLLHPKINISLVKRLFLTMLNKWN